MNHPSDTTLNTVSVPDDFHQVFLTAQNYVKNYFSTVQHNPEKGLIKFSGERYILVRAASMSKEFFDMMALLYKDRGEKEARTLSFNFLFDIAHSIGKADAKSFFSKMKVSDPIEKLSAGPVHFAYTGWASVKIHPLSNPVPNKNFYLIYDHPYSFEAQAWMENGEKSDFPVCVMNAGYSSGWCEESFSVSLVTAEIECRAKGDRHCRFIMAHPSRIKDCISKYCKKAYIKYKHYKKIDIPEFFKRKRLQDELKNHRAHLENLVQRRTDKLRKANLRLEEANIALKVVLKQMEQKEKNDKENFLINIKQSVMPYLKQLAQTNISKGQQVLLDRLEKNMNQITSPLIGKLSSKYLNLTPMEIKVAALVKDGMVNKEIAQILNVSLNTITSHRYKIRTKLGLKNRKTNLHSYLLSLEE
ncbi:MAG: LuxR C-terminal-related transcriptional regulator [Desulfobacula sp.]|uniref:LuxR C-terminal-related transcriptional regulator n=1 Tax=Desulfobacula sp. TaxID=2593537 RepID=UPI0025BC9ECB|nr:LuxR C-terminal-related transcriptional regulator [Desulfobacula sp.]MCD4720199.1 LuxR C-terminal-related transcriptional regulator [Desulfobacula sp.]